MISVWYHEAAEQEVLAVVGYFEQRAHRLGARFLAELRRVEDQICSFPESGAQIVRGIRKCVLRKFPYSVIYSIEADKVIVLAVAHHHRAPFYWVDRAVDTSEGAE